jgi:hypothetical protein
MNQLISIFIRAPSSSVQLRAAREILWRQGDTDRLCFGQLWATLDFSSSGMGTYGHILHNLSIGTTMYYHILSQQFGLTCDVLLFVGNFTLGRNQMQAVFAALSVWFLDHFRFCCLAVHASNSQGDVRWSAMMCMVPLGFGWFGFGSWLNEVNRTWTVPDYDFLRGKMALIHKQMEVATCLSSTSKG